MKVKLGVRTLESMMAPIIEDDDEYDRPESSGSISYREPTPGAIQDELDNLMERYEACFMLLNRQTLWDLPMIVEPDPEDGTQVID